MAFRLRPDGTIETDTIAEMLALNATLKAASPVASTTTNKVSEPSIVPSSAPTLDAEWAKFIEQATPEWRRDQQVLLGELRSAGGKIVTRDRLRETLHYNSNAAIGGIIRAIELATKRVGLRPTDILHRDDRGLRAGKLLLQRELPPTWPVSVASAPAWAPASQTPSSEA